MNQLQDSAPADGVLYDLTRKVCAYWSPDFPGTDCITITAAHVLDNIGIALSLTVIVVMAALMIFSEE